MPFQRLPPEVCTSLCLCQAAWEASILPRARPFVKLFVRPRSKLTVIRRHWASSGVIRRHQASLGVIRRHQASFGAIRRHPASSGVIRSFGVIRLFVRPFSKPTVKVVEGVTDSGRVLIHAPARREGRGRAHALTATLTVPGAFGRRRRAHEVPELWCECERGLALGLHLWGEARAPW